MLCGTRLAPRIRCGNYALRVQGENTPEALALAMEDAAGRVAQQPADQLDALFGCLSRAMPNLPGRPNFMQEMLGLEVSEVRPRPRPMSFNFALTQPEQSCKSNFARAILL